MANLAAALDIGTTNIGGALIDLDKKRVISSLDVPNEQIAYGDDIISRLKFAGAKDGIRELNKKVLNSINNIIDSLIKKSKADKGDLVRILAVGNTAMYHLTLLFPVETLATAPYEAFESKLIKKEASGLGLKKFSKTEFIFLPNIGGFVGSDALGVIIATNMHKNGPVKLAIDLGTNGEIILGNKDKILVTSTAAGPAFEGWHISCGMRPAPGAIIHFDIKNSKTSVKTIGNLLPKGIAGSGLIKIIGKLVENGRIDKTGRLTPDVFTVYEKGKRKIYLNQKDIREVQLAKSAIFTAITFLKINYDLDYQNLYETIVTGRFGGALDAKDLLRIAAVPREAGGKKFNFIENLALKGASILLAENRIEEIESILKITKHVELQKEKAFQEEFAKGLAF